MVCFAKPIFSLRHIKDLIIFVFEDVVISSNEASPTDKATNDSSTTETSSIKKVDNLPTDNAGGNDSETMKGGSDKTKEIDNNPNSKPSDKSQPENGSSDNQQNNEDPTGYEGSKFSKPGDEQVHIKMSLLHRLI